MLSVLSVVMAIIQWRRRQRRRCRKLPVKYGPLLSSDLVRQTRFDELESDSDECHEVAALAAASSQVSSSSVKSMKPNKRNFKRVGKSNTLPAAARVGRASKSNTKPSPACVDDDMDVQITNALRGIK